MIWLLSKHFCMNDFLLLNVFWTERPFFARKLGFWSFKGNDSIPHSLSSKNFQFRNCIFKINKSSLWLFFYSLLFCITLENSGGLIGSFYPGITVTMAHFLCCSLHQLLGFSWFLCAKRTQTWFYSVRAESETRCRQHECHSWRKK